MTIFNSIIKDFKDNILEQFVSVITFGFGVTSFYKCLFIFVTQGNFTLSSNDFVFLFLSFLGFLISLYFLKDKISIKYKIYKSLNFIFNILGFVLMFVPCIIFFEYILQSDISYEAIIIQNSIISFILSIVLFFSKSIIKTIF